MKVSKFGLFLLSLCMFVFSGSVRLQQGVNGYDGCVDATTCATSSNVKFESHHQLSLENFTNG